MPITWSGGCWLSMRSGRHYSSTHLPVSIRTIKWSARFFVRDASVASLDDEFSSWKTMAHNGPACALQLDHERPSPFSIAACLAEYSYMTNASSMLALIKFLCAVDLELSSPIFFTHCNLQSGCWLARPSTADCIMAMAFDLGLFLNLDARQYQYYIRQLSFPKLASHF